MPARRFPPSDQIRGSPIKRENRWERCQRGRMFVRSRTWGLAPVLVRHPTLPLCAPAFAHAARMGDKAKPSAARQRNRRLCCESANDNSPLPAAVVGRGCNRCCTRYRYLLRGWKQMARRTSLCAHWCGPRPRYLLRGWRRMGRHTSLWAHWCGRRRRGGLQTSRFSLVNE
jgi:hypothetical protein